MKRIGTLAAGISTLRLHGSPNGAEKGFMYRGDELVLDDIAPRKNPGGKLWWVRGSVFVHKRGTLYDNVWVARSKIDIVTFVDDAKPPVPLPPLDPLNAPLPLPEPPPRGFIAAVLWFFGILATLFAAACGLWWHA